MSKKSRKADAPPGAPPKHPPAPRLHIPRVQISSRDFGLAVLLIGMLLFVYLPALNGGAVWDDDAHITRSDLQSWRGLGRIWFQPGATEEYVPLLHTAFWIEYQLWADNLAGYHLINLALHAASAFLLVLLLRRLDLPGAWPAAFLFAFHPVNVESVAWISEQKNALSTVFYLSAALLYLRFDRTRLRSHYLVAFGLFVAALLSKTVTATLPAALLILLWWMHGKLDRTRDLRPLAPWLALGVAAEIFAGWASRRTLGGAGAHFTLNLMERILLAGRVIWFYLAKLVWPVNLMFVYPRWTISTHVAWQWLFPIGALALGAALWLLARAHPARRLFRAPLAGFLFFAVTLLPVLGLFDLSPFVYTFVGDHHLYQASLGILIPVACLLAWAARKAALLPAVVVAVLAIVSWNHTSVFRDAETLYSETIFRNPESWKAHTNQGLLLSSQKGRSAEDMANMRSAVRLNPDSSEAHLNLGVFVSDLAGHSQEAIAEYRTALRLDPNSAVAHNDLGNALAEVPGGVPEAISEYEAALRIDPRYAEAHNNLGSTLSQMEGHTSEALAEFEAAVYDNPQLAEAQANLGTALAKTPGRTAEAIPHLEAALRLRPDMGPVRELLGRMQQDAEKQKQKQQGK